MSNTSDTFKLISEVRRDTRNPKVIDLCDIALSLAHRVAELEATADVVVTPPKTRATVKARVVKVTDGNKAAPFDKTAYQREYMAKRRAQKKKPGN